MENLNVKCYNPTKPAGELEIFILSKGNNAGKPLWLPCPNCFVIKSKNKEQQEELYWLLYGLWQGCFFHPFIKGSVIPFIRKDDVKQVLQIAFDKIGNKQQEFGQTLSLLQMLEQQAANIQAQIKLIKQAKKALMFKVFR